MEERALQAALGARPIWGYSKRDTTRRHDQYILILQSHTKEDFWAGGHGVAAGHSFMTHIAEESCMLRDTPKGNEAGIRRSIHPNSTQLIQMVGPWFFISARMPHPCKRKEDFRVQTSHACSVQKASTLGQHKDRRSCHVVGPISQKSQS